MQGIAILITYYYFFCYYDPKLAILVIFPISDSPVEGGIGELQSGGGNCLSQHQPSFPYSQVLLFSIPLFFCEKLCAKWTEKPDHNPRLKKNHWELVYSNLSTRKNTYRYIFLARTVIHFWKFAQPVVSGEWVLHSIRGIFCAGLFPRFLAGQLCRFFFFPSLISSPVFCIGQVIVKPDTSLVP